MRVAVSCNNKNSRKSLVLSRLPGRELAVLLCKVITRDDEVVAAVVITDRPPGTWLATILHPSCVVLLDGINNSKHIRPATREHEPH